MKKNKFLRHVLSLVLVATFLILAFGSDSDDEAKNPDGTIKTAHQKQIEKMFSAWDGSHRGLNQMIKKSMNDEASFEHVKTIYWDMDDHVVIRTTYSGSNSFGARVKGWVKAKADTNGNIIEILEEGSGN